MRGLGGRRLIPAEAGTGSTANGDGRSVVDVDLAFVTEPVARSEDLLIRAVNVVVAALALLLLSPLILLIALAIRLDSPGPAFYKQLRVGIDRRREVDAPPRSHPRRVADLGGRPFLMYKFRTMYVHAEHETGPVWASPADGRTTRLGKFLRRSRLDEIPQFWNVLRGDMSIVGPRPERPSFVHHLREEFDVYPLRQRVPPGITGWAQVNHAPDQSVDDVRTKLCYDLEYLRDRSLTFDLRIMVRTVPVMLAGHVRPNGSKGEG